MRFSQAQLGIRAERPIEFEIRGAPCSFAIRPLSGSEEASVLSRATEYAKAKGADKAEPGNAIFDLALMMNSLAVACVDTDSPPEARTPFWDGGASQVESNLDTEQITFLYARYELWQSECSPSRGKVSSEELVKLLVEMAGSDGNYDFLARMRLGTLASCLHITAQLLLGSPEGRSALTSLTEKSTPNTSAKPSPQSHKPKNR